MAARHGTSISLILALVFPSIVGAAMALAYYGYRYANNLSRHSEASFREDSREMAERLIGTIQNRIDDVDYELFRGVDVSGEEGEPPRVPAEPPAGVQSFVVLDQSFRILHMVPGPEPKARRASEAEWRKYLEHLDWGSLLPWTPERVGNFRHRHQVFGGDSVLVAYAAKKAASGASYHVAAKLDLPFIRQDWLPQAVKALRGTRLIAVVDEQARRIFGPPMPAGDERFLYDASFGKTLYNWRIQIAPRNVQELQENARAQQLLGRLLIPFSTAIIALGLVVVWLVLWAERRTSQLKSEFIANVSHELKTPLSLVRMFGELIATGRHKGEGTAKEYAGIITREAERLSHLIDNVLDFARLERGKVSYDFAERQLEEVVERALDVCRYRLEKERMRLLTSITPGLPPSRIDENAMTLVLLNLVDNAIKHGSEGGEVDVSLGSAPGWLVLKVSDRGPGVPPEEHRRIFERFYRARSARERNVRGSGIGLALVKHIAEAHGGRVDVSSRPGGGATFRVFLPAAPTEGLEEAATTASGEREIPGSTRGEAGGAPAGSPRTSTEVAKL